MTGSETLGVVGTHVVVAAAGEAERREGRWGGWGKGRPGTLGRGALTRCCKQHTGKAPERTRTRTVQENERGAVQGQRTHTRQEGRGRVGAARRGGEAPGHPPLVTEDVNIGVLHAEADEDPGFNGLPCPYLFHRGN